MNPQQISEQELRNRAEKLHTAGTPWHMHVLSPGCKLNTRDAHAIFLEDTETGENFVTYSDKPMQPTARAIARLMHGEKSVLPPIPGERPENPTIRRMMTRAEELECSHKHWHHHIFFPQCCFNPHPGKWTMIFEDPENSEIITSVTDEYPDKDVGITERLYYAQKY